MSKALVASPSIKAIETLYNGIRFRSRLEARWAVFFDCLDIRYLYEHEGYTDGRTRYLPDFFLPDLGCFVEIKPKDFGADGIKKASMLSRSGVPVYLFSGDVGCTAIKFIGGEVYLYGYSENPQEWRISCCVRCQSVSIIPWFENGKCSCPEISFLGTPSPQIVAAGVVATQVRFERLPDLDKSKVFGFWLETWTSGLLKILQSPTGVYAFSQVAQEQIRGAEESRELGEE